MNSFLYSMNLIDLFRLFNEKCGLIFEILMVSKPGFIVWGAVILVLSKCKIF